MVALDAEIAQAGVEEAISKECTLFTASTDILTKAKSLAGLSILVAQLDLQAGARLGGAIAGLPLPLVEMLPELLRLLGDTSDEHLQKNSVALLTSISAASQAAWQHLLEAGYVQACIQGLSQAGLADGTRLNLVAALIEVVNGGDQAAELLLQHQGVRQLLACCPADAPPQLQEAVAESMCALGACDPRFRPAILEQGALPALAALAVQPADNDVRVRALMGLGMIIPGNEAAQLELVQHPGFVHALLAAMRESDDRDCQVIARDIFAGLASNPSCKEHAAVAMRAAASIPADASN